MNDEAPGPSVAVTRLDAFVDAAFAFAVTLLVIASGEPPQTLADLRTAVWNIPAFAIGFALVGMFWHAHVRWRRECGSGEALPVVLSFLLVFLVLVYVYPLQMMANSFARLMQGLPLGFQRGDVGSLFVIYGAGFAAMSATVTALFAHGLRRHAEAGPRRGQIRGERGIWAMLTLSGLLSTALACFEATAIIAPWVYSLLPVAIGIFVARHDWADRKALESTT